MNNGSIFAWGANESGQLGNNSIMSENIPISVSSTDSYVKVCGSKGQTTGSMIAIRGSDGLAYAWGYNGLSQLGDNSLTNRSLPTSVSSADSWVDVAIGSGHSLAVRGSDGLVYTWGQNNAGQLGINSRTDTSLPVSVSTASSFTKVIIGSGSSFLLRSDGLVYSCGQNPSRQLGDNSITSRSVPVSVSSADSFSQIACGYSHGIGLRGADGKIYAWGYNGYGNLGNNSTTNRSTPGSVSLANSYIKIAAQGDFNIAIRSDGRLFAWGDNRYGQLGDNSITIRSVPVSVYSADSFVDVALGYRHSLAKRGDGAIFAWGADDYGQLGLATFSKRPILVMKLPD